MNPALPGGAPDAAATGSTAGWVFGGGISYTGISYGELQQGTDAAPNPDELQVDVHLATLRLDLSVPSGTQLALMLPTGRLSSSTVDGSSVDRNIGDLEVQVSQLLPWLDRPRVTVGLGLVVPSGPYVERSGAANLPPEASFLTLGRGVSWILGEARASHAVSRRLSGYVQLSARAPLGRTSDDFQWGNEARVALGARYAVGDRLAGLAITEWQWRGGASEPDPFSDMRLETVNAGGNWYTFSPAISVKVTDRVSALGGLRVPVHADVRGNQLVPGLGGFVALSGTWERGTKSAERPLVANPEVRPGRITVIDYWASWCAPCKTIDKRLKAAEESWPDVKVVRIDASEWPDKSVTIPREAKGLPVVEVYGRDGRRAHVLLGEDALNVVSVVEEMRGQ